MKYKKNDINKIKECINYFENNNISVFDCVYKFDVKLGAFYYYKNKLLNSETQKPKQEQQIKEKIKVNNIHDFFLKPEPKPKPKPEPKIKTDGKKLKRFDINLLNIE